MAEEKYLLTRYCNETNDYSKNLLKFFIKNNTFDLYNAFISAIRQNNPEKINDFRSGMLYIEFGPFSPLANLLHITRNLILNILAKIKNLLKTIF